MDQARGAVTDWLASAHAVPTQAHMEFGVGIALLQTGLIFDTLRLPAPVVHAAAGSNDPDAVAAFLAEAINGGGAVIQDAYGAGVWYYALVPLGTHARWRVADVECLEPGTWLGVPRLDLTARPGPHWALAPRAVGCVCAVRAVADLVALGKTRLRQMPAPERTL